MADRDISGATADIGPVIIRLITMMQLIRPEKNLAGKIAGKAGMYLPACLRTDGINEASGYPSVEMQTLESPGQKDLYILFRILQSRRATLSFRWTLRSPAWDSAVMF